MTPHYYRGVHAVVLVYDVTNQTSLDALDHWLEELEGHGVGLEVPRVLVGNKCDQGRIQPADNLPIQLNQKKTISPFQNRS